MKLDAKAEALLKKLHTRRVEGDGYAVEVIMPMVVRYRKGAKSLTLGCEPRRSALDIYVEAPVAWDDESEPMTRLELDEAISRIKRALAEKKLRYEFFYREAAEQPAPGPTTPRS